MSPHQPNSPRHGVPAPYPTEPHEGGESLASTVPLSHILRVLRRHLWLVLATVTASVAAVGGLAYFMEPAYRAVAVIRLSDPRRALTGGVLDDPARVDERFSDPLLSQAELLTSRKVAAAVVDSLPVLRLRTRDFPPGLLGVMAVAHAADTQSLSLTFRPDRFGAAGTFGEEWAAYGTPVDAGDVRFTVLRKAMSDEGTVSVLPRDAAISRLIEGLLVKRRLSTDIFDIAYTTSDPYLAQQVVNHTVDIFQSASAESAQQQAGQRRAFLEGQLEINDSLLTEAWRELAAFRRDAGGSREALVREQVALAGLEFQRQELLAERSTYQRLLASFRDVGATSIALETALSTRDVAANPAVAQLSRQLFAYETARDSLANRSTSHPDLPRLQELVVSTEARLVSAVQASVQSAIAALDGRIAAMDDLRMRQRQRSNREAEEERLIGRTDNLRLVSDELRTEYQKAGIAEAVTIGQVEVVDRAILPLEPVGLGIVEQLTLALLVGLAFGSGGAFMAERLRTSIAHRTQVEHLGIPILGVVPRFKHADLTRNAARQEAAVEAFRGIRHGLMNAHGADRPLLVTVTSPGSGDGKSFISTNLALAFAYANARTLLVDADARRGALHRPLHQSGEPGLTDVLSGSVAVERALRTTNHPSLDFLASGSRRRDAPELLGSPTMEAVVARLRSSYEVVVIDSPPLGAGIDAFTLARLAGSVLVVLRLGRTDRALTEAKLEVLRRFPLRVLHAVLNDVWEESEHRAYANYLEGYELANEPLFQPVVADGPGGRGNSTGRSIHADVPVAPRPR